MSFFPWWFNGIPEKIEFLISQGHTCAASYTVGEIIMYSELARARLINQYG
jgi:hypothetical protein